MILSKSINDNVLVYVNLLCAYVVYVNLVCAYTVYICLEFSWGVCEYSIHYHNIEYNIIPVYTVIHYVNRTFRKSSFNK